MCQAVGRTGTGTQTPLPDRQAAKPMRTEPDARCQTSLLHVPFLLYLPLLCQAPLQVSVPRLAGIQLGLQLLPRLTDRAHSRSESQPTADWRHTASFGSEWNRTLFNFHMIQFWFIRQNLQICDKTDESTMMNLPNSIQQLSINTQRTLLRIWARPTIKMWMMTWRKTLILQANQL